MDEARDYEAALASATRQIEATGVTGQDADDLAAELVARAAIAGRITAPRPLDVRCKVRNFRLSETRRKRREVKASESSPSHRSLSLSLSLSLSGHPTAEQVAQTKKAADRAMHEVALRMPLAHLQAFAEWRVEGRSLRAIAAKRTGSKSTWGRRRAAVRAALVGAFDRHGLDARVAEQCPGISQVIHSHLDLWARVPASSSTKSRKMGQARFGGP